VALADAVHQVRESNNAGGTGTALKTPERQLTAPNGPPQRGMWIPPATTHDVRAMGAVRLQSLYIEP